MSRKRGFFAEIQHQARVAEQQRQRQAAAQNRQYAAAQRIAAAAQRADERSYAAALRMSAAEQKQAMVEAKRLHEESMKAQAELQTQEANNLQTEIANILLATVGVDDFVDLESLRVTVQHPPFPHPELLVAAPPPRPIEVPDEPVYQPAAPPSGMSKLFGRKKFEEQTATAQAQHATAHQQWQEHVNQIPGWQAQQADAWTQADRQRLTRLAAAQQSYEQQCRVRREAVLSENARLDQFIEALGRNEEAAIQDYVGIVLGNSVYPDVFPVEHDFTFDVSSHELTLTVSVPAPQDLPGIREVRFNRAKDVLIPVPLTQREQQARYTTALACTALRSVHEVFQADRENRIRTIALTVQTVTVQPATGQITGIPLLALAADRGKFTTYDLARVDPLATLALMNATIARNPMSLTPIKIAGDVRD